MKLKMVTQKGSSFVILLVLISAFLVWVGFSTLGTPEVPDYASEKTGDVLNTYESKEYGITFQYPTNWTVTEFDGAGAPIVNVRPTTASSDAVVDVNDNVTHFSLYPNALEDFDISGVSFETNFGSEVSSVDTEYLLDNGSWWARSLEWTDNNDKTVDGVLWISREINDLDYICEDDEGTNIDIEECNETEGDIVKRTGTVDTSRDETLDKILSSFAILE